MTQTISSYALSEHTTSRHPRICFVGPMLGRHAGWVPNPAEILAPRLAQAGYTCLLTSPVRNRYLRLLDIIQTLVRARRRIDIICLQAYSGPSIVVELVVGILAKMIRRPVVTVLHGGDMPAFMSRHPRVTKRVLGYTCVLVTPSPYLAHSVQRHGFVARVIPNMIDLDRYPFRPRRNLRPRLLWMRTFHPIYNPELAIDVLEQVSRVYPDVTLTMAGQEKGSLETVRRRALDRGLQDRVRFAGFFDMPRKQAEFAAHDIFLNTNHIDNMPVSLVEAGAFGLPIVATAVGGIPFLLRHAESALLVPDGDAAAMSGAVTRLLSDPDLAERLSAAGRHLAEQCDWSRTRALWDSVFETAMNVPR